jgi:hypothetical protein
MSEDLEALLREHYRRAAEGITPDAELVERGRRAARPTRARTWPRVLAAAAAIAVIAAVTWGLLRPAHRDQSPATPPAPPAPAGDVPMPSPPRRTPSPASTVRPRVSPPRPRGTPVRSAPRSPARAVPTPTAVRPTPANTRRP